MSDDGLWQLVCDIDRFEVIDDTGKVYGFWGVEGTVGIEMHKQDNGKTLKIFVYGERRRHATLLEGKGVMGSYEV